MSKLALILAAAVMVAGNAQGSTANDERAIRALNEVFAQGMVKKDPQLRASVFLEDATLLPPNTGFLTGREAIEKHFQSEGKLYDACESILSLQPYAPAEIG